MFDDQLLLFVIGPQTEREMLVGKELRRDCYKQETMNNRANEVASFKLDVNNKLTSVRRDVYNKWQEFSEKCTVELGDKFSSSDAGAK